MFYRLGVDIGETSIGWFILRLNEYMEVCDIIDGGVYISRTAGRLNPANRYLFPVEWRAVSGVIMIVRTIESVG